MLEVVYLSRVRWLVPANSQIQGEERRSELGGGVCVCWGRDLAFARNRIITEY